MFRAPKPSQLPHLHTVIQNIGYPLPTVADYLDISTATMRRYIREGQAPRAVMLALFWESQWGYSVIECEQINRARLIYMENRALKLQIGQLEQLISTLEHERDHGTGAANSPIYLAL